jgi:hypothetical protein
MTYYRRVSQIIEANKEAGQFFFSANTMRFFKSRVLFGVYGGRYFITSEKKCFNDFTRVYSVQEIKENGSIDSIAKFDSIYRARKEAQRLGDLADLEATK